MRDDETGEYLGCLEVSQDITSIQNLVGEKRLDGHEKTTSEYENQVAKSIKKSTDGAVRGEMPDFVKKMLAEKETKNS